MILTGKEIAKGVANGGITIDPFNAEQINPNSYNYRINETIRISESLPIDSCCPPRWIEHRMPPGGFTLYPGRLYLASTLERLGSHNYVTTLIGRSSLGRLGMFLTTSADLGNLGSPHCWTLEIKVVQPLVIYPHMKVGQVSFWTTIGKRASYTGPYSGYDDPAPALIDRIAFARAPLHAT